MTRLKKEFKKRGFKFEEDYPYLPYFIRGKSIFDRGYIFIDGIGLNKETATYYECLNVMTMATKLNRDGSLTQFDPDEEKGW